MFEDILDNKKETNVLIVCPTCHTRIFEIVNDIDSDDYIVDTYEHECALCTKGGK